MPVVQGQPVTIPEANIAHALDRMIEQGRTDLGYEFQAQVLGLPQEKGSSRADFKIPLHSLILSVLGLYWHESSDARAKDRFQAIMLESRGWRTIWIDENHANSNPKYYIEEALLGISHSIYALR